ncbi:MAG: Xaa-Pro peptidase family protein, partial [Muribaculaceae bacterium]|nr:Xaa-Pro peptidase family protein [Muribaculaceae bacterium]
MQPDFQSPELRHQTGLRLRRVVDGMASTGLDALLLADNANVFYMSGRYYRGYVYVTRTGKCIYFIIHPDIFAPADNVVSIRKPEQIPSELTRMGIDLPHAVGLEYDALSYSEVSRLAKVFGEAVSADCSGVMRGARMVKTPYEIELMRIDGVHQSAVYERIGRLYRRDMTDLEFQVEIERALRLEGCLGYTRVAGRLMEINMGSVISGDNADVPSPYDFAMGGAGQSPSLPGGADGMTMKHGTTVMVDMNGNFNGYQTDMTRVWSVGEIPEEALKAHECSRRILRALERETLPGVEIRSLYDRAMEIVREEGLERYFMGHNRQVTFIGHGVGIELNEQPAITARCRQIVEEGMTLALEPKFVIPGIGAVGVENTYVVRADGLECLTVCPYEIKSLI